MQEQNVLTGKLGTKRSNLKICHILKKLLILHHQLVNTDLSMPTRLQIRISCCFFKNSRASMLSMLLMKHAMDNTLNRPTVVVDSTKSKVKAAHRVWSHMKVNLCKKPLKNCNIHKYFFLIYIMSNLKLCNWSFLASVLWYLHCRGLYFLYYKKSPLKRFLRKGFASDAFFTLTRPRLCAKTSITLLKIFIKLCKNLSFVNWYISCEQ